MDHHGHLPYLYGVYKPSKASFRWIAGTAKERSEKKKEGKPRASVYCPAKTAVKLLRVVMDTLREISDVRFRDLGIKTCWFVESLEEVAMKLRRLAPCVVRQEMRTVDFVNMYTMLPHARLLENVQAAVQEAWSFQESKIGAKARLGTEGWNAGGDLFDISEVMQILQFLVENSFVSNGGVVRRQVQGIPMGLAVSPQLANLYCYVVERDFAMSHGKRDADASRWIDDIHAFGDIPSEEQYGMKYKQVSTSPETVTFVGIKITKEIKDGVPCGLVLGVHWRDEGYPVRIIRYPSYSSACSAQHLRGVIFGQFVRCQRICNRLSTFKEAVGRVTLQAIRRGYPVRVMRNVFDRFLRERWHTRDVLFGELRAWYRRCLRWATSTNRLESRSMTWRQVPKPAAQDGRMGDGATEVPAAPDATEKAVPSTPQPSPEVPPTSEGIAHAEEQTRGERSERSSPSDTASMLRGLQQLGGHLSQSAGRLLSEWWKTSFRPNTQGSRQNETRRQPDSAEGDSGDAECGSGAETGHPSIGSDRDNVSTWECEGTQTDLQVRFGLWNKLGRAKGNLCFLNASLQIMSRILPKRHGQWIVSRAKPVTAALAETLARMSWSCGRSVLNPTAFRSAAFRRLPRFGDGRQHDAMEFLGIIWEVLQEEACASAAEERGRDRGVDTANSVVWDTMMFIETSTVECLTCGGRSTTSRSTTHIVLAIPGAFSVTLEECLADYFDCEILDGVNAYECPNCPRKTRGEKKITLDRLPRVMVIGLKRVQYNQGAREVRTAVRSPRRLDLSAFACGSHPEEVYDLVGVINHAGRDGSGHYTADIQGERDHVWYHFDDERAGPSDGYRAREVVVLVYERSAVTFGRQEASQMSQHREAPKVWTLLRTRRESVDRLSKIQDGRRQKQIAQERAHPVGIPRTVPEPERIAIKEASERFAMFVEEGRDRQKLRAKRGTIALSEPNRELLRMSRQKEEELRVGLEVEQLTERQLLEEGLCLALKMLARIPATNELRADRRQKEMPLPTTDVSVCEPPVQNTQRDGRRRGSEQGSHKNTCGPSNGPGLVQLEQREMDHRTELMDSWRAEVSKSKESWSELAARYKEMCLEQERCKLQRMEETLKKSYYEALGVPRTASAKAIRAAYRRLVLECHPDKFPQEAAKATALFQELQRAHDTLSDPKLKEAYDRKLHTAPPGERAKQRSEAEEESEPVRPEPRGECGRFPVISLAKRFGLDPEVVRREDTRVRKARTDLNIFSSPTKAGACWIILPGARIERASYLCCQLVSAGGKWWEVQVAHVEGHSAAMELTPALRLFCTQWEAEAVRSALLGTGWW
jgi:ubiquitin C-terminal hydrolase